MVTNVCIVFKYQNLCKFRGCNFNINHYSQNYSINRKNIGSPKAHLSTYPTTIEPLEEHLQGINYILNNGNLHDMWFVKRIYAKAQENGCLATIIKYATYT